MGQGFYVCHVYKYDYQRGPFRSMDPVVLVSNTVERRLLGLDGTNEKSLDNRRLGQSKT